MNAGKGAQASVLTKMIRPQQPLPDNSRGHRSLVIIEDRFLNQNGKQCYHFRYPNLDINEPLMFASTHYVRIVREGEPSLFFDEPVDRQDNKFVEPKVKWRNSHAKEKLFNDLNNGLVPLDSKEIGNNKMAIRDIYLMHPEYAAYDYEKFSSRLASIRKTVKEMNTRADEDQEAFDIFVRNHDVSLFSKMGFIQWQGSESQRLLLDDIKAGKHNEFVNNKKEWYLSRPEYYNEIPLKVF